MATKRFVIDGFGQVELNNVAFRRDGRIEAQCALDETDFASIPAENGSRSTSAPAQWRFQGSPGSCRPGSAQPWWSHPPRWRGSGPARRISGNQYRS